MVDSPSSPANADQEVGAEAEDLLVRELKDAAGRPYVSLRKAADLIGVTYQTVLRYIRSDPLIPDSEPLLKAVMVGKRWRVYADDLKKFLDGSPIA